MYYFLFSLSFSLTSGIKNLNDSRNPRSRMGQGGGNLLENLPILDDKNWHWWYARMKVILGYQEVLEIVEKGYSSLAEDATKEQKVAYNENKK